MGRGFVHVVETWRKLKRGRAGREDRMSQIWLAG